MGSGPATVFTMKLLVFTSAFLAGVFADNSVVPIQGTRRMGMINHYIKHTLRDVSQAIKDAGLDPFYFEGIALNFELPMPVSIGNIKFKPIICYLPFSGKWCKDSSGNKVSLLKLDAIFADITIAGISDIRPDVMDFSVLSSFLDMDVNIPQISASVGNLSVDLNLMGTNYSLYVSGQLAVLKPRIYGTVGVSETGVVAGTLVKSMILHVDVNDIQFVGSVKFQDVEFAPQIKELISNVLVFFNENKDYIEEIVLTVAWTGLLILGYADEKDIPASANYLRVKIEEIVMAVAWQALLILGYADEKDIPASANLTNMLGLAVL